VKPYKTLFTFKNCGRTALHVIVHKNRKSMYRALAKEGHKTKTGRATTLYWTGENKATIHFSRGCVGSEVVAHESVHGAYWLLQTDARAKRYKDHQESIAFWTGQIMRAIVSDFYANGIYK